MRHMGCHFFVDVGGYVKCQLALICPFRGLCGGVVRGRRLVFPHSATGVTCSMDAAPASARSMASLDAQRLGNDWT